MGEWGDREVGKFQLILQNPKTSKPQNLNYLFLALRFVLCNGLGL